MQALFHWLNGHLKILGVLSILICIGTWAIDLAEWVQPCAFCRTQRTAIGIVGILMLLPNPRAWWVRWPAACLCYFGAHVGSQQLFMILYAIDEHKPWGKVNFVMASGALIILIGQALLLFTKKNEN